MEWKQNSGLNNPGIEVRQEVSEGPGAVEPLKHSSNVHKGELRLLLLAYLDLVSFFFLNIQRVLYLLIML